MPTIPGPFRARHLYGGLAVIGAVLAAATITIAAGTSSTDQYTGCLTSNGSLINVAVGDSPAQACTPDNKKPEKSELQISWNAQGPAGTDGLPGAEGPAGADGPPGPAGADGTSCTVADNGTATMTCPDRTSATFATLVVGRDCSPSAWVPDADLTGCDLTDADLTFADLSGAVWHNTTCPDGSASGTGGAACPV